MSRSLPKPGLLLLCIVLIVAAFLRGNYLAGLFAGVLWAVFALLVSLAIFDVQSYSKGMAIWGRFVLVLVTIPIAYILVFRLEQDPVLTVLNNVSNEVSAIIASDSRFSDLGVSTVKTKTINVRINGSVEERIDLDEFRNRVKKEIQQPHIMVWNVTDRNTRAIYEGSDSEVFGKHD